MNIDLAVSVLKDALPEGPIAEGRIFGVELPKSEAEHMPREAVVVVLSGGPEDSGFQALEVDSLKIYSIADTPSASYALARRVHRRLKFFAASRRDGRKLHGFTRGAGIVFFRSPNTDWPTSSESWILRASG